MLVTKELNEKVLDYKYPWGEILSYIAWEIRYFYRHTLKSEIYQSVFVKDMIFKISSIIDWRVVTT